MDQWMKLTEHQTEPPTGTTITMANWRQYQSVMPLGMIKLFQTVSPRSPTTCRTRTWRCGVAMPMPNTSCLTSTTRRPRN